MTEPLPSAAECGDQLARQRASVQDTGAVVANRSEGCGQCRACDAGAGHRQRSRPQKVTAVEHQADIRKRVRLPVRRQGDQILGQGVGEFEAEPGEFFGRSGDLGPPQATVFGPEGQRQREPGAAGQPGFRPMDRQ